MIPHLRDYDRILVNSSAGKDSQAMLDRVIELADAAGVRQRVVVVHCDLGRVEWAGTKELAEEQARHYGVTFCVVLRAKHDLLAEVRSRGKWMSSGQRYCTSYYKREPALRLMTAIGKRVGRGCRILNCYGFRAQESPRRKKLPQFQMNRRATSRHRHVDDWLPIQDWSTEDVWARIRRAGTPHHPAYELGMPRLSCCFCIFAPKAALMIAAKANPELFEEYLAVEREIGHKFRVSLALADVDAALKSGEQVGQLTDEWNM